MKMMNLHKNTAELREVEVEALLLNAHKPADMRTELFGHLYDAPFGIAPDWLQD